MINSSLRLWAELDFPAARSRSDLLSDYSPFPVNSPFFVIPTLGGIRYRSKRIAASQLNYFVDILK